MAGSDATPPNSAGAKLLRSHSTATLVAAGVAPRIRYVVDDAGGLPVSVVEGGVLACEEWVLHIPEESDASLQVLVTPRTINPDSHHACDRYLIYHGTPEHRHWVEWQIESARFARQVFDPEDFAAANPLAIAQSSICKRFNADRECIARLCLGGVKMRPIDPLLVGVDPWGADIRARFGIIRVEFPSPAIDADAAAAMIEQFIAEGGA